MSTEMPPRAGPVAAFARLGLVLALGVALAIVLHAVAVLVVVLAIVAMIMLHELGHFIAAKASGMKVTEYFLGFGPKLWSVRKGETEYGVKLLPAGGYVRITGMTMLEEVEADDEPRSYRQATFPRRLAVAVAGSTMHFLIALALCWSLFVFIGQPVRTNPYVTGLLKFAHARTPAQKAGLRPGDRFISIDGHPVRSFAELEHEVGPNAGKVLSVLVSRDGRIRHLSIRPVNGRHVVEYSAGTRVKPNLKSPGIIGVELSSGTTRPVGVLRAVPHAFSEFRSLVVVTGTGLATVFSFHGLSEFVRSVVTAGRHHAPSGASSSSSSSGGQASVLSILGVIQIGSQAATIDPGYLLLLLALVNLFVGIVNLFPMLPLDGGHVVIALYERIRSRRGSRYHADVLKLMPVAYVFLGFIVLLGLGALYANIVQPVHLPGG